MFSLYYFITFLADWRLSLADFYDFYNLLLLLWVLVSVGDLFYLFSLFLSLHAARGESFYFCLLKGDFLLLEGECNGE